MIITNDERHSQVRDLERRYYRIEIPNIVDELGLSPGAFRLYVHMKRVAGANPDGICYQGSRKLAKECGFALGRVPNLKKELLRPRAELGGKSLIRAAGKYASTYDSQTKVTDSFTVTDIWDDNLAYFKAGRRRSNNEQQSDTEQVAFMNDVQNGVQSQRSSGEPKKEPIEERTLQEVTHERESLAYASPLSFGEFETESEEDMGLSQKVRNTAADLRAASIPENFNPNFDMLYWAATTFPNISVKDATTKFVSHYRARRNIKLVDWNAEWRKWMANERPSSNRSEEELWDESFYNKLGAITEIEDFMEDSEKFVITLDEFVRGLPELSLETIKSCLASKVRNASYANPAEDYYFDLWKYQLDSEHRQAVDEELEELGIEYSLPENEEEANRLGFKFSNYEGTLVLSRNYRI